MGGRKLKWSHRLRECLRAQRHPPFPLLLLFLPSCTDLHLHLLLVREKKTRRRILEHRGIAVVYNESGVNLILTPLYHQDVSHGRGHSRGTQAYVYNPFVVTVTNFREDGPSSRSLIAYYFLSSFSLVCVSFVSPLLFDPEPRLRAMRERERENSAGWQSFFPRLRPSSHRPHPRSTSFEKLFYKDIALKGHSSSTSLFLREGVRECFNGDFQLGFDYRMIYIIIDSFQIFSRLRKRDHFVLIIKYSLEAWKYCLE